MRPGPGGARLQVLTLQELDRWWVFYRRLDRPGPYHRPDYLELIGRYRYPESRPELFVVERGGELVYYPYFRRSLSALAGSEDLGDYDDLISSWYYGGPIATSPSGELGRLFGRLFCEHCEQTNVVSELVRFDPYLGNHRLAHEKLELEHERDVIYVDLRLPEAEIVGRYRRKCGRNIRRAVESGLEVGFRVKEGEIESFSRLYDLRMQQLGALSGYRFRPGFFSELLRLPGAHLVALRRGADFLGGSIEVGEGRVVHDYLRATDPDAWHLRGNDLLVHRNLEHFRSLGYETFDLQGGRRGVREFKESFSRSELPFWIGRAVHRAEIYDELSRRVGARDTGFFPAYRRRESNPTSA